MFMRRRERGGLISWRVGKVRLSGLRRGEKKEKKRKGGGGGHSEEEAEIEKKRLRKIREKGKEGLERKAREEERKG